MVHWNGFTFTILNVYWKRHWWFHRNKLSSVSHLKSKINNLACSERMVFTYGTGVIESLLRLLKQCDYILQPDLIRERLEIMKMKSEFLLDIIDFFYACLFIHTHTRTGCCHAITIICNLAVDLNCKSFDRWTQIISCL